MDDCTLSARVMLARKGVGMLSAVSVKDGIFVWHLLGRWSARDYDVGIVFAA